MEIDQAAVQGEPGTGYENPEGKGLFQCANCAYFQSGYCHQRTMMARSKQAKNAAGQVKVDPKGCCEYIERSGDGDRPQAQSAFAALKQAHQTRVQRSAETKE